MNQSSELSEIVHTDPHYAAGGDRSMAPIDRILEIALTSDKIDLDRLERLYEFKRKYDADMARNAFVAAMARFKSEPVVIEKDKHVFFQTSKGKTEYWHATIGNVVRQLVPALAKHGFSHRWDQRQDGGKIIVTCVLTHEQGHSEAYSMSASPDDTGNKNAIQQVSSTGTYLQRYTLLGVTGYATIDQFDDDAVAAEETPEETAKRQEREKIMEQWEVAFRSAGTPAEMAELKRTLIKECGGSDMVPERLLQAYKERLAAIQDAAPKK